MAQRWDRDRYERERYGLDRDTHSRFGGSDRFAPAPRRTTEVLLDERVRGPRGYEEKERYIEEERYLPARRPAPSFLDEPVSAEAMRQALAPYRRPRPQIIRKQSSLDTFDRRPRRYEDDFRLPAEVPIPLPIRRPRSPSRERYYEEVEERYRDSDEEYRDVRVNRGSGRSRSRMRSRSVRRRRSVSSSSASSVEENKVTLVGRRGRTKVPKRLAHKDAVIELGYPFVEEDNFIIVQRALDKVHIDQIVEISKKYREGMFRRVLEIVQLTREDKTVTYAYNGVLEEEKKETVEEDVKVKKEEIIERPSSPSVKSVTEEPPAEKVVEKRIITTTTIDPPDHHHRHQDLAVAVPRHHHMSEHDIRREIRALEAEAEALRLERHTDRDVEIESRRKDIYRVERNRKGRLALIRSAH